MSDNLIPVIDLSSPSFDQGTPEWESVRSKVQKAAEEFGCFLVLYKKISIDIQEAIVAESKEVFDLPLETKMRNVPDVPYGGYIQPQRGAQLFESLSFHGSAGSFEKTAQSFANVFWPEGRPSFSETVKPFSSGVVELEKNIKRMILESLGVEKYYDELSDEADYLLRLIKYEGPKTDKVEGLEAHRDKTALTILYQNGVDGFEVQAKNGDWFSIKMSPNHFIVTIGNSFRAWTNNRLHAALHRVTMSGKEARYSFGLFSGFKLDYEIKAPQGLVDDEHPLQFKPFKFGDFLNYNRTGMGENELKYELEYFCGVKPIPADD